MLELGEDALGTGLAKIIQPIVAVPASSGDANLHQPGPDLLRSRLDGDSPCGVKRRMLDHVVAGHGTGHLFVGGSPPQLPGTDEAQVHSQQNDSQGYYSYTYFFEHRTPPVLIPVSPFEQEAL